MKYLIYKIKFVLSLFIAVLTVTVCYSQNRNDIKAGTVLSDKQIESIGLDNLFSIEPIDDSLFNVINNKSYKANCTIPLDQLCYLKVLHCDIDGTTYMGELICNIAIGDDLIDIFKNLYLSSYPIERMILIDNYNADDDKSMANNNTSAFNFRYIAGTTKLSNHSSGMAVDINPLYNPYVKTKDGKTTVEPQQSMEYVNRELDNPYMIKKDDICYKLFKKHGFDWGGSWISVKDYQHFEKKK